MSLVVIENGGLGFGSRELFSALSLRVGEEDRIGLVGRNGSGKSSLLKIIASCQELEVGTVRYARGARIGYLPQDIGVLERGTVIDFVLASVPGRDRIEEMLVSVEEDLAAGGDEESVMAKSQKLVDLHEELTRFDSMFSRHEALRILAGLGFDDERTASGLDTLSGGWRMRAVLASLLFQRPDLLLLDEPTNHLDVPAVAWLTDFLRRHHGAVMLVCHDREFLNDQVTRIVAFETEGVRQYKGNFQDYRRARAEELGVLERRAANLARERDQAERFIRRFRYQASRARAVQSRLKALERLDDVAIPTQKADISFEFPPYKQSGQEVIRLDKVSFDYGYGLVLREVSALVRRGDRVALVGANGNGKSTLLRIMAGLLSPTSGVRVEGHNVEIGYYAQQVADELDLGNSVFDEIWRASVVQDLRRVRSALGTMLFSGDDVDKKIGILSGGEKARVALVRLMVCPGNVVLMDEPTNHLDLECSEALAEALSSFAGTLVFASHNRSFVNRLATRIFNVDGGTVEEYAGTLDEYMERCARLGSGAAPDLPNGGVEARGESRAAEELGAERSVLRESNARLSREQERQRRARVRTAERRIVEYEARIAELECQQAERSEILSSAATYADRALYERVLGEYQRDAKKLEELLGRWEVTQSELADLVE